MHASCKTPFKVWDDTWHPTSAAQPQSNKTHTSCSTQHEYGTVPDTLSQQGSPCQTLARPGSVAWWWYGVLAQTSCRPLQPAVHVSLVDSFIHSFMHSCLPSINHSFNHSFIHACIHFIIHSCLHSIIYSFYVSFFHLFLPFFLPTLVRLYPFNTCLPLGSGTCSLAELPAATACSTGLWC